MTTTLKTSDVVAAVVSAFHNAADLTRNIIKKSKKKKGEQAHRQKWLLETLESGELQISQRYGQYLQELGERFRVGDDVSRGRLQHVAIIMQAELLRSLQVAGQSETVGLDAGKLQDDAAFFRRDVLSALDELRERLLREGPPQPAPLFSQMVPHQRSSVSSPTTPGTPGSDVFPSGVTLPPANEEEHHSRMGRLFSMRSKHQKRSSTSSGTIQNMVVAPTLSWLGPVQKEPEHFELPAEDVQPQQHPPAPYPDIKVPIPEPDTEMLHPAMAKHTSIDRHASTSTHSSDFSNYTRNSTFSDEKIPVVNENDESFFPDAADLAAALPPAVAPPPLNVRQRGDRFSSVSSQFDSTLMSPTEPFSPNSPIAPSPTGLTPGYSPHSYWFPQHNAPTSDPSNLPIPVRDRSNTVSSDAPSSHSNSFRRASSIASTPSSHNTHATHNTVQLVGRPEKKNNYWGFCKGAWTIREDWHKGLAVQAVPAGMFGTEQVWQCRHCTYQGAIFGAKKPYMTDPNVREDAATGVRYRWIFLAKSHTKVRLATKQSDAGFACLFCSLDNVQSSVFGNESLLFRHILDEHAPDMTDALAQRAKCIVGRRAEAREAFDINII